MQRVRDTGRCRPISVFPGRADLRGALRQSLNAGKSIEAAVKGQDLFDFILLHDREVDCVTCRDAWMAQHDLLGALCG